MPPDIDAVNRYFTDDYYGWGKTSLNFPNSKSPGTCLSPYPSCKLTSPLNFSFSHSPSACLAHTDLVQALISQPSNPLSDSPRSIERIQILWQEDQGSESTFPTTPSRPSPETNLLAGEILHFAPVIAFKENPSPVPSPNDTIFFSRALTICVFEKSFWWQCVGWVRTQGHQRQEVITLLWYYRRHVWRAWNRQWMKKRGCILKIWKGLGDGLVFSTTAFGGWEGRGRAYSFITHSHKGRRVPSTGQMHSKKCLKSPSQQKVWQGELYLCFFSTSGVATSTSKEPWRCCYHHSGQHDVPLTIYSLQLLNICFKWRWVGKGKKRNKE